jgi:hypothetical protein
MNSPERLSQPEPQRTPQRLELGASLGQSRWLRLLLLLPLLLPMLLLMLLLAGCGVTAPKSSEGFADLDSMGLLDTDNTITLSFGPSLLRFVAAAEDDDHEAAALLKDLDGLRIRIYEIDNHDEGASARVAQRMERLQVGLRDDGWEPVMLVRQKGEQVHLLAKVIDDRILGLTLLAMEDAMDGGGEVVVINLMGNIRPQNFSKVMVALDVEQQSARNVQVAN